MSLDFLDLHSVINFGMTCRQARFLVMTYLRRRISKIVEFFDLDPARLFGLMSLYEAVIAGEHAKSVFAPAIMDPDIPSPTLEFNVGWRVAHRFVGQILELGEFAVKSDTNVYHDNGSLYKKVWWVKNQGNTNTTHRHIKIISFVDESL